MRGCAESDAWAVLMGARLRGRHAVSVPGRDRRGATRRGSHLVSPVDPGSHVPTVPGDTRHWSRVQELTKEIEMSMIRRSRTVFSIFAAVLIFAFVAPIAVNAD